MPPENGKPAAGIDRGGPSNVSRQGHSNSTRKCASNQCQLVVHAADRPATVYALRAIIAKAAYCFDRGGVPIELIRPADGGLRVAKRMTHNNVIALAHEHCQPVKLDKAGNKIPITLPDNVAKMYLDLGEFELRPLDGITAAPLLGPDGSVRDLAGYDPSLALWCEPVPGLLLPDRPTKADAENALLLIRNAFCTFCFKDASTVWQGDVRSVDTSTPPSMSESSFLNGLLTAVCRPSIHLAPGLIVTAPEVTGAGAGKGLIVRAICAIAYGSQPAAFTCGHDRQELDKRLAAALLEAAPAVFLDNVNSTVLRSDTLASVLTERPARVRIMGLSEMAPLNSAAFIALTGNGLSVSEDLARRFLAVDLDPQCEDPDARPFKPGFLDDILNQRSGLLNAALTIWRWGRQNNLAAGLPLGSYEAWSQWVRDPLLALGCADPVERIRAAKASDPRRQLVVEFFEVWHRHHGEDPVSAAELAGPVEQVINPQSRPRQYVAQRLRQMIGTRGAGLVLTHQPPAGRWAAATYALKSTTQR